MKHHAIVTLLLVCALSACGGGHSSTSSNAANSPSANPGTGSSATARIIEDEDLTPGLKGTDANNNGIRDDVDRLIAKKYSATPALKKAAEQSARALQKFMEATTKRTVLIAGDGIQRADACIAKVMPLSNPQNEKLFVAMSKEFEALTANTKERFTAYWGANRLAGGEVFEQPNEPVCD